MMTVKDIFFIATDVCVTTEPNYTAKRIRIFTPSVFQESAALFYILHKLYLPSIKNLKVINYIFKCFIVFRWYQHE
jgi:hypothetical protein